MKVIEHLEGADRPLISYEIIPPLRGGTLAALLALIDALMPYEPPFIDVTSHPAEAVYKKAPQGFERKVKRKRPGTLGLCSLIQHKYGVDAVPHVLCHSFTREETEDFLIELKYLGIDNVLAVRGDDSGWKKDLPEGRSQNGRAVDLVRQIGDMNRGRYLEEDLLNAEPTAFCVGVAGYAEKHFEAPNLLADVRWMKEKVEAGADYIVTQLFYDNERYHAYVAECRRQGIEVPIIPGLKILTHRTHLTNLPRRFHVDIPPELADEVLAAEPRHTVEIGVEWALRQVEDLLAHDVPSVHFFVMQDSTAITKLLDGLNL